jgi:hypothetical protein
MALKDWWNRLIGRGAGKASTDAERQLDLRRQQYEAEQTARGRMSGTQGGGNVGF